MTIFDHQSLAEASDKVFVVVGPVGHEPDVQRLLAFIDEQDALALVACYEWLRQHGIGDAATFAVCSVPLVHPIVSQ